MKWGFLIVVCIISFNSLGQETLEDYEALYNTNLSGPKELVVLDSIIAKIGHSNDGKLADYSEVFVDKAIVLGQYKDAIRIAVKSIHHINIGLQQTSRADKILAKVEPYRDSISDSYLRGAIHLKRGGVYFNGRGFEKASENYLKALEFFGEKDSIDMADAIYFNGQAQFELGNHLEAINNYQKANELYRLLKDYVYEQYTEGAIISVYGINGFNQKAIDARKRLIEKVKRKGKSGLITLYNNQAINYKKLNNIEKQEENLLAAYTQLKENNVLISSTASINIHSSLSDLYANQGKLEEALKYLQPIEKVEAELDPNSIPYMNYRLAIANYYHNNNQSSKAIAIAINIKELVVQSEKVSLEITMKELLAKAYKKNGQPEKALNYFQEAKVLQDSIYGVTKTNALSFYQSQFETERRLKEIVENEATINLLDKEMELAKTKNGLYAAGAGAIGLLFLFSFLYLRNRSRQKQKLLEVELQGHKESLEVYTQELLSTSTSHEKLREELNRLKKNVGNEDHISKLQDLMTFKILTPEHWDNFKGKFNRVYPQLLIKARHVNNDITNSEERLIALEKLNLKTSEIAKILGVSPDSVTKMRYRLRKKLGINKEISI